MSERLDSRQFTEPPLIYVFTKNKLPRYAFHSLSIARKNFSGQILLLTDQVGSRVPNGIEVIEVGDWYDCQDFDDFARESPLDPNFRAGFWLHAAERFFLLNQFMKKHSVSAAFHAELDALILNLDGIAAKLNQRGKGFFCPLESAGRAIASLSYFNDASVSDELVKYMIENAHLGTEMALIGSFMSQSAHAHELPSDNLVKSLKKKSNPDKRERSTVFDAAFFGQWLFGIDPKNTHRSTTNLYHNDFARRTKLPLKFQANFWGNRLYVINGGGETFQICMLHLHSKCFRRLRIPGVLALYSCFASNQQKVVVSIQWNAWIWHLQRVILGQKSVGILRKLPSFFRAALSRILARLLVASPRPVSERSLSGFAQILGNQKPKTVLLAKVQSVGTTPTSQVAGIGRLKGEGADTDLALSRQIILSSFENPHLVRIIGSPSVRFGKESAAFDDKRHPVFVEGRKAYFQSRLAKTFWGLPEKSFAIGISAHVQVVRNAWVIEMFDGDPLIVDSWCTSLKALETEWPEDGITFLNNYGVWALAMKSNSVQLSGRPVFD